MALVADANLLCFGCLRRQAVLGWYFLQHVVLCVDAAGFTLRHKDRRVLAQLPARRLLSCGAPPWNESGQRLWLEFAGGDGDKAHTRARVLFDLDLQSAADVALLQHVCDALLLCPAAGVASAAHSAAECGLLGADVAVLKRGELQRYKKGWHTAVLIRGKLLLFSSASVAAGDDAALRTALPRHVYSLDGVSVQGKDGSQQLTLQNARTGKTVRLCAPSRADASAWRLALQGAQQQPLRLEVPQPAATLAAVVAEREVAAPSDSSAREGAARAAGPMHEAHAEEEEPFTPAPAAANFSDVGQAGEVEMVPLRVAARHVEEEHTGLVSATAAETPPRDAAVDHLPPAAARVVVEGLARQPEAEAGAPAELQAADATTTALAEQRRAAARAAVERQAAWVPRSTHDQVEAFLRRFPDVERRDAYRLRAEFDAFDLAGRGALEVDAAMRLLESRHETRTFRELRQMAEGVHIQSSAKRRLSFLEWACAVFRKDWLELCLENAQLVGDASTAQSTDDAAERQARYDAMRRSADELERADAEREQRELAQRRAELRRRSERFERSSTV